MVEALCADEFNCPRGRFRFVIASFLLLIVVNPYIEAFAGLSVFSDIFFASILISMVYSVAHERKRALVALLLASPVVLSLLLKNIVESSLVSLVGSVFAILFIGYTIYIVIWFIAGQKKVTADVLHAAIVVYLLMGVFWSLVYFVVEYFEPGSFKGVTAKVTGDSLGFLYYSFVTLTTLGYGDITPVTSRASAFTILEALVGQMYLVVQVAWLVGRYSASPFEGNGKGPADNGDGPRGKT